MFVGEGRARAPRLTAAAALSRLPLAVAGRALLPLTAAARQAVLVFLVLGTKVVDNQICVF